MYEVKLTKAEMLALEKTVAKYRDNFDDYPGSQMILTDKNTFTEATNFFLTAAAKSRRQPSVETAQIPVRSLQRTDIDIRRTTDEGYHIRAGGAFGILATTAVAYESDMTTDPGPKATLDSIVNKFLNQADISAAEKKLRIG